MPCGTLSLKCVADCGSAAERTKEEGTGHLRHGHAVVAASLQVLPDVIRDLLTGCEPNAWFRFHVSNQLVEIHDS